MYNISMKEIVQVLTSLFDCVKKEINDILDMKDLREEINDLISDLKDDISTLEKKIYSLNLKIDIINQYEHRDDLVISGDIISHGTPTKNYEEIVLYLFRQHLNTNLGEDELFLKLTREEIEHIIFYATCELIIT